MIEENPQLEQKTSGEIFEDVFNDNSLDNKNKLWTSNEVYDKEKEFILNKLKDFNRSCVLNRYSEFEIIKFLGILIQELEKKNELRKG